MEVNIYKYNNDNAPIYQTGKPLAHEKLSDPYVFTNLIPGKFEAVARRYDHPTIRKYFEVEKGQKEYHLTLQIPEGSASLSGNINFGDIKYPPQLMLRNEDNSVIAPIRLMSDGTFEIKNLPKGNYIVGKTYEAVGQKTIFKEISLQANQNKSVDINGAADQIQDSEGYLVVVVVTEEQELLPGTKVWLQRDDTNIHPHFNTDDGKSFTGAAGEYTLHAEYPGYEPVRVKIEMKDKTKLNTQGILWPLVIHMKKI